jgi:hypothetical protein
MFLYNLKLASHIRLPFKVRQSIKVLQNYNICPKELFDKLFTENEILYLQSIKRSGFKWRKNKLN